MTRRRYAWARALRRLVVRTEQGRLRPLWMLAHELVVRFAASYLGRREPGITVYAAGSFAQDDPLYGLSDIDLVAVSRAGSERAAGIVRDRLQRRWGRACSLIPGLQRIVEITVVDADALSLDHGATTFTYGLESAATTSARAYRQENSFGPELSRLLRPGLGAPTETWRRLRGQPVFETASFPSTERRLAAWLELQWWWRYAFAACTSPAGASAAYLCFKVVADSARIWLWLVHSEGAAGRVDALERALDRLPEEEAALRQALQLRRSLYVTRPPVRETLEWLVRLSERLARWIEADVQREAGATQVELVGMDDLMLAIDAGTPERLRDLTRGASHGRLLPLADWRARTLPLIADETFAVVTGDPTDPETITAYARAGVQDPYPLLPGDGILLLPAADLWSRVLLRAVQCRSSDPVSFALVAGSTIAHFPDVPGWSAQHAAQRAVHEHIGWLTGDTRRGEEPIKTLAWLLTAVRAAVFYESTAAGAPELPLTLAAAVSGLDQVRSSAGRVAENAYAEFRASRAEGRSPAATAITSLRPVVLGLGPYAATPSVSRVKS